VDVAGGPAAAGTPQNLMNVYSAGHGFDWR
jgi:hypothetical protein